MFVLLQYKYFPVIKGSIRFRFNIVDIASTHVHTPKDFLNVRMCQQIDMPIFCENVEQWQQELPTSTNTQRKSIKYTSGKTQFIYLYLLIYLQISS